MKRNRILPVVLSGMLCAAAVLLGSCSEEDIPVVYDSGNTGGPAATITGVSPASALGLITQVTLTGQNFGAVDTQNFVYFGTTPGTIISGTTTSLVVVPPDLDMDQYTIKVVVPGVFQPATYGPYVVEPAGIEYGNFQDLDDVFSIAMDGSENLYAQQAAVNTTTDTAKVYKVDPNQVKTVYGYLLDASLKGWPKASDMRIGPGGYLYLQQTNNVNMYRIAPGGGITQPYVTLPGRASTIEFDSSGNIFAGGSLSLAGIFAVHPDRSMKAVGSYTGMNIKALRVFGGYLYVAVATPAASAGVWKSQILDNAGTLGANVRVLTWSAAGGTYPSSGVTSMTIAADGTIYVGTDNNSNPILAVPPVGTPASLYPGVLSPPATQLVWGNGQYLYCNRESTSGSVPRRIIRIAMGKNGATDFGRK